MPYAPTPHVLLEQDGPVAVITLNNPDERNALLDDMHEALREIWWHLAFDRTVRAAVITGAGSAFSAGGNIPTFIRDYDDPEHRRMSLWGKRLLALLQSDDRKLNIGPLGACAANWNPQEWLTANRGR